MTKDEEPIYVSDMHEMVIILHRMRRYAVMTGMVGSEYLKMDLLSNGKVRTNKTDG